MEKPNPSKEWTAQERLEVISRIAARSSHQIVEDGRSNRKDAFRAFASIWMVASFSAQELEDGRSNVLRDDC